MTLSRNPPYNLTTSPPKSPATTSPLRPASPWCPRPRPDIRITDIWVWDYDPPFNSDAAAASFVAESGGSVVVREQTVPSLSEYDDKNLSTFLDLVLVELWRGDCAKLHQTPLVSSFLAARPDKTRRAINIMSKRTPGDPELTVEQALKFLVEVVKGTADMKLEGTMEFLFTYSRKPKATIVDHLTKISTLRKEINEVMLAAEAATDGDAAPALLDRLDTVGIPEAMPNKFWG